MIRDLAHALRMLGHAVDVACTAAADALEIVTARIPDVVPEAWVSENIEWTWWDQR